MAKNFEQRDMSGSVFVNNRKEKETHPDRTGRCMINGQMFWISGWIKQKPSDGEHWLSLAFKEMSPDESERYAPKGADATQPQWQGSDKEQVPF